MPRPHPALSFGRPQVFAHRGGAALRPENTILAFDHGMSLGADGLEFDVHLSRDGVVVVHHDTTLERTTNGQGPLAALTADELARLDAGFHFDGFRGAAGGVPALKDVLRRYPAALFIIELKVNDPVLAHKTIDEVRAAGALDRVAVGSFGTRVLRAARAYEPRILSGASREETRLALYRSWVRWPVRHPPNDAFQVPEQLRRDPRRLAALRAATPTTPASRCRCGPSNEAADMQRLLDWGVDGIISDRPDRAVEVVRGRHAT